jgi:hypothetical protein
MRKLGQVILAAAVVAFFAMPVFAGNGQTPECAKLLSDMPAAFGISRKPLTVPERSHRGAELLACAADGKTDAKDSDLDALTSQGYVTTALGGTRGFLESQGKWQDFEASDLKTHTASGPHYSRTPTLASCAGYLDTQNFSEHLMRDESFDELNAGMTPSQAADTPWPSPRRAEGNSVSRRHTALDSRCWAWKPLKG